MKIAIIDDEPDIGFILGFEFQSLGYQIVNFDSALKAMKYFEDGHSADAIVCDFQMPKMSGLDFFHWVKSRGFTGNFYILTGEPTMDQKLLIKAGITDIFFKPDDLKRLISTVK